MIPMEEGTSSGFLSFLLAIAVVSLAAQTYAEAAGDRQAGVTLTAGEIDSSTVEVGAFAVVIHGLGERHPVSGAWESLKTDRGYIVAIGAETLILGLGRDEGPEVIALERIQTLVLPGTSVLKGEARVSRRTKGELAGKAQSLSPKAPNKNSTEVDSSRAVSQLRETPDGRSMGRVKERHRLFIENPAFRLLAKVAVGTVSGVYFTGVSAGVAGQFDPPSEGNVKKTHRELGLLLFGASIGCSVGFPWGVSVVDPYDSWPKTLLSGVIPGVAGYSWAIADPESFAIPSLLVYVVPPVSSLIVSEVSRKLPQDRRVFFGLAPTLNGGLSAVAQLRF